MEAGPRDTDQRDTEQDAPDTRHEAGRLSPDGPDENDVTPEVEVELRPAGRLRIWQLAPIVMLAAVGSLMFAFPLAFEFGDGGENRIELRQIERFAGNVGVHKHATRAEILDRAPRFRHRAFDIGHA